MFLIRLYFITLYQCFLSLTDIIQLIQSEQLYHLSFIERFCFILSCTSSSIQLSMDLMYCNDTKRKIIFLFIYIMVHILFTLYTTIFTYICHLNRSISQEVIISYQNHYVIILLLSKQIIMSTLSSINHHISFQA